jgi:hypothetical protein
MIDYSAAFSRRDMKVGLDGDWMNFPFYTA